MRIWELENKFDKETSKNKITIKNIHIIYDIIYEHQKYTSNR